MTNTQLQNPPVTTRVAVIPDIVQQFADNCAFLWTQRELTAGSRNFVSTFSDLEGLDDRIDANLDGLRCSGVEGWDTVEEALSAKGSGEVFTAAILAFENELANPNSLGEERLEILFAQAEEIKDFVRPASVALHWTSDQECRTGLHWLFAQSPDVCRAVAILAASARGMDCSAQIESAVQTDVDILVEAACKAALRTTQQRALYLLEDLCGNAAKPRNFTAVETACLLGSRRVHDVLRGVCTDEESPFAERAASLLFRTLDPRLAPQFFSEIFGGRVSRAGLSAAAATGTREMIPFIVKLIEDKKYGKFASELFSLVVGAPIQQFQTNGRESIASVTNEESEDSVALDPDHGRSDADAGLASNWWREHESEFAPAIRYLNGQPVTRDLLVELLHSGVQTHRLAAADLLVLSRWAEPWFDVYAPAFRQYQGLAEIRWR